LTIEQQLNCFCDTLAKDAVVRSLNITSAPSQQRLAQESVAVFVGGLKQTSDVAKDVRFALARVEAERLYTSPPNPKDNRGNRKPGRGLGWFNQAFNAVAWDAFDATLDLKGQMYRLWLSNQLSGFCGMQVMVSHWDKGRDGLCPDCGKRETASHLNLCSDPDRTHLLHGMVSNL